LKGSRFEPSPPEWGSRGISVSIVSGYRLDDWAIEVRSSAEAKRILHLAYVSRPGLGPPSLLSNGYRGPFPGGKARPGRDAERWGREWVGAIHPLPLRLHRCVVGLIYLQNTKQEC
jgi:hypothetical protein